MERKVKRQVRGFGTQDGAGVKLVRVLGYETMEEYDPILMLDSFDSTNPDDYTDGFPMHPHRGIETISYVYRGQMIHRDSLGNEDSISDGEVQWMTAGSGILHEEKLPASERMLGVQLWLNLPAKDKMTAPSYHSIKNAEIEEIDLGNGMLRLLAGQYKDKKGYRSKYLPLDYYDIHLDSNSSVLLDTDPDRLVMIFTLTGEVSIDGELVKEKTAAKLTSGDRVEIKCNEKNAQVLFISSTPLGEPIAWGGPIVMNTKAELQKAFADLDKGTFLQKEMSYDNK
ncbi:pirin family protein [Lacrimispora saccharolytica]|uniref:Pirin domain protein n=1 Tax=Lacrimispora saccharolytica (strain ATCC 35040 / DSM 2544 / NRCC 2533 / WM1) TaxID=610130 RepID=D9R4L1_LACSW|nr:pirin family protein [Lacrimispora saccharolytica]ADL03195.1 Pirin domain protein [[Clostridium] saccharolyticum WM1]QRV18629.1 pirin family protein [Lacrimispora saccharolytica]